MVQPSDVIDLARSAGATVASAESLTGGLVCAALVDVPGASDVVRGAVVAYAADVKIALLGVDADLVATHGTVHPQVAEQMAEGVRAACGASHGVSTTGVAGPGPSEGQPAGTVFVAVAGPAGTVSTRVDVAGGRAQVRSGAVGAALSLLVATLGEESPGVER
ncbi:CinA family protein [Aeromicrobium sp. CF3.5]|uniref:CinA family protein n=1 Tax=Aeromicrobium sp. CF3.5 TaxID=3373078 RepID=UPI003EE79082